MTEDKENESEVITSIEVYLHLRAVQFIGAGMQLLNTPHPFTKGFGFFLINTGFAIAAVSKLLRDSEDLEVDAEERETSLGDEPDLEQ